MDPTTLSSLHAAHVHELQRATEQVLRAHGVDALVLHSGSPMLRTRFDDIYWPVRASPWFLHWAPLQEAHCHLIVRPGQKPVLLRPKDFDFWETPPEPESNHFWGPFDVREGTRAALLSEAKSLCAGKVAFVGDDLSAAADLGLAEHANEKTLMRALDQLRVHKDAYEELCLAEANRRAAVGHDELRRLFAAGDLPELELHLAFLRSTNQDDTDTPYKNIVALGHHAATLHHVAYAKRAQPALSMLVDAGASFAGYAADITRTWVKGGSAGASAFAQLVAQVERFQQELCKEALPGREYESLHDRSHELVAEALHVVGVGKASPQELVDSGLTRAFFPHGLGHSLGLVCHDVGCALRAPKKGNEWLRNTSTITERQTFTIEPGIYFIPELLAPFRAGPHAASIDWALCDELGKLGGIRIEDDVVVGPASLGVRNLTRELLPRGGGDPAEAQAPSLLPR
jgi:Xaa-Pro dipeptidase